MATVYLPAPLRPLVGGEAAVDAEGRTLGEVIDDLERRFPGVRERLVDGERLRGGLAVFVDDQMPLGGLKARVEPGSRVYFAPAVAGG
jgi:molybdopterin converting factor small subunit